MDKTSSSTNSTAPASPLHHKQEVAMVASPPREEAAAAARNVKTKKARQQQAGGERKPRPQQDLALNCPRCDSTNTKFCYYNNYSVTQPRYFCKACRRYWTQGGTLRNVPVGGGSRKNKLQRASSAAAPSVSSSSSSSSKKVNSITQQLMMMPTASAMTTMPADFPNVLPTFMSTGGGLSFELPLPTSMVMHHQVSLPFAPLSVPSNPDGGSATTPSLLDMLRGGFLDGSSSYGSNGIFPPPSSGAMPIHGHGMGASTDQHGTQLVGPLLQGVEEVKPMATVTGGLQWASPPQHGNINDGGFAAAGSAGGAVQQQQQLVGDGGSSSNNNGGASASSSREYYWQGDLINSNSLI